MRGPGAAHPQGPPWQVTGVGHPVDCRAGPLSSKVSLLPASQLCRQIIDDGRIASVCEPKAEMGQLQPWGRSSPHLLPLPDFLLPLQS